MTVLVVGSTRIRGSKIVAAVLDKRTVEVKAMVRSNNDSHQQEGQKIDEMKAKSAGIVQGDLMKGETLRRACAEVDVIVSAVGNNEVTVLGQKKLIDPATKQGVKRFLPADYSVDYRKLSRLGDNLDMPKQVFEYLFVARALARWGSTLKR